MKKVIQRIPWLGFCTTYEDRKVTHINKVHWDMQAVIQEYWWTVWDILKAEWRYELKEVDKIKNKLLDIIYRFMT